MQVERAPGASLEQVLSRDNIAVLLDDPAVCARLAPLLPEGAPQTRAELEAVVRSPQFHQAVQALNAGLQSGQLAPLAAQLGLDASVGGPYGGNVLDRDGDGMVVPGRSRSALSCHGTMCAECTGVEAFLQAIQAQAAREAQAPPPSSTSNQPPAGSDGSNPPPPAPTSE